MVSTHSQYITDFTPKTMEPGKSPLALLAKTCETIGLPETPLKKSPTEKKDEKSHHHHHHHSSTSSNKIKSSPRATPASKEPTLTFPGLPKPQFPMAAAGMPYPFFNPMMPYPMPFPFPTAGFMGMPGAPRMPCPFAMMRQPCLIPGCAQCIPTSATGSAAAAGFTPEMMAQFATHPLFSAYAGMMPTASGASNLPNYQSLLAACASTSSTTPTTSRTSPKVSTTTTTVPTSSSATTTPAPALTPTSTKHRCNWMESNGVCGKKFNDEEELANHVKSIHTPSPPSSASSTSNPDSGSATNTTSAAPTSAAGPMKTPTSRPSSSASQIRFNPYGKPAGAQQSLPTTPMMMQMPNPLMLPFPLQAMYTQRLMSSMQHP